LQRLVRSLEDTQEFRALGTNARHAFDATSAFDLKGEADDVWAAEAERIHLGEWQRAVGHFFRRSGAYLHAFDGKTLDPEPLYRRFSDQCQRATTQVTHLALIDGVSFSEPFMDFGTFRFGISRLPTLNASSNRVNSVFYPDVMVDTDRLQEYWFIIIVRPTMLADKVSELIIIPPEPEPKVEVQFSQFPSFLARAIRVLRSTSGATIFLDFRRAKLACGGRYPERIN
jgi:hypothetical protein